MSDYNPLITDRETRDLLNKILLEQDDALIENLIEMESKIMYTHEPLILPAMAGGEQVLSKLNHKFAGKILMKWVFTTLTLVSVITTFLIVKSYNNTPAEVPSSPVTDPVASPEEPAPQMSMLPPVSKDSTAENNFTPEHLSADTTKPVAPLAPSAAPEPPAKPETGEMNFGHTFSTPLKEPSNAHTKSSSSVDTIFKGIKSIEVNGQFCDVHVRATGGDEVHVKGSLSVNVKGFTLKKLHYTIECEREGDVLKVKVVSQNEANQVMVGKMTSDGILEIALPASTNMQLKNASGNISVKGLNGKQCEVESIFGDILVENIQTNMKLKSSSGNITLQKIKGDVDAHSLFGDQFFTEITGDLQTFSSSGNVNLSSITGNVNIESRYGDIKIKRMSGTLTVKSSSGDVTVTDASGKLCTVKSSYGNIDLTNVTSPVKISSKSGNVDLEHLSGDMDISATYGNVSMNTCKGNLYIQVTSGNISGRNVTVSDSASFKSTFGDLRMNLMNDVSDLSFDLQSVSGDIRVMSEGKNSVHSNDAKYYLRRGRVWVKAYTASGDQTFE